MFGRLLMSSQFPNKMLLIFLLPFITKYHFSLLSVRFVSTTRWLKLLDQGYSICSVFFDLKKAFDSVPHRPLLAKLNLPGNLLAWLQSYLTSRSQQVVVEGATSFKIPVISGVPQGSILGPLPLHFICQ